MIRRICVYCGSRHGAMPAFTEAARATARAIARRGLGLVYGGGSVGLMGELADAALAAGGSVIGVIPRALFQREVAHDRLTELVEVASMHERKAKMAELADAFVALPGGFGTLEETFEALTWTQLGLHAKPVGLLDVAGFFEPLLRFLDRTVEFGFVRPENRDHLTVDVDPERLVERIVGGASRGDLRVEWATPR